MPANPLAGLQLLAQASALPEHPEGLVSRPHFLRSPGCRGVDLLSWLPESVENNVLILSFHVQ